MLFELPRLIKAVSLWHRTASARVRVWTISCTTCGEQNGAGTGSPGISVSQRQCHSSNTPCFSSSKIFVGEIQKFEARGIFNTSDALSEIWTIKNEKHFRYQDVT